MRISFFFFRCSFFRSGPPQETKSPVLRSTSPPFQTIAHPSFLELRDRFEDVPHKPIEQLDAFFLLYLGFGAFVIFLRPLFQAVPPLACRFPLLDRKWPPLSRATPFKATPLFFFLVDGPFKSDKVCSDNRSFSFLGCPREVAI